MLSVNEYIAEKLKEIVWEQTVQMSDVYLLIDKFFEDLPNLCFDKAVCKPCWRCHGTGTNEGMA